MNSTGFKSSKFKMIKVAVITIFLVSLTFVCFIMTSKLHVNAEMSKFSLADITRAAATYFNLACSPAGDGVRSDPVGSWQTAGGVVGYQNDEVGQDSAYYICARDAGNAVTYNKSTLAAIPTGSGKINEQKGQLHDASSIGTANVGGNDSCAKYYNYGHVLNQINFDDVGYNESNTGRMAIGTLMLVFYSLSNVASKFFDFVIEVMQNANPFALVTSEGATDGPLGGNGTFSIPGVPDLGGKILDYYSVTMQIGVTVVAILVLWALATALISRAAESGYGSALLPKLKNCFIKVVAVFLGAPLACGLYQGTLNILSNDLVNELRSKNETIVNATFVDFESWMLDDRLAPKDGMSGFINGTKPAASELRSLCLKVNGVTDTAGTGFFGFEESVFHSGSPESNADSIKLLTSYARGEKVSAGIIGSEAMRGTDCDEIELTIMSDWHNYSLHNYQNVYDDTGKVVSDDKMKAYVSNIFSKSMWVQNGSGLSDAAAFNYLNSEFKDSGVTVYSPETSNQSSKHEHYSVNLIGSSYIGFVLFLDDLVLMGLLAYVIIAYGLSMMTAALKSTFQAVVACFGMAAGMLKGLANTAVICVALMMNILVTCIFLEFIVAIIKGVYGILGVLVEKLNGVVDLSSDAAYAGLIVVGMVFALGLAKKLVTYRQAAVQVATDTFTAAINKILGTNAAAPNMMTKGGLQAAAAIGAGLAMTAGHHGSGGASSHSSRASKSGGGSGSLGVTNPLVAAGDVASDMGNPWGDGSSLVGSLSDGSTSDSDNDYTSGYRGATGSEANSDNAKIMHNNADGTSQAVVDKDGNLLDKDGNKITDADGNLLDKDGNPTGEKANEGGYHIDENGNLVDKDGNAVMDENGNLVDKDGNPIKDADGNNVNINGESDSDKNGLHTDENGNLVDKNGKTTVDSDGNLQDKNGNVLADANGNLTKPMQDSDGNTVDKIGDGGYHMDENGNLVDKNGKPITNDDGNLIDPETGNEILDENGDPINMIPKDSDSNTEADGATQAAMSSNEAQAAAYAKEISDGKFDANSFFSDGENNSSSLETDQGNIPSMSIPDDSNTGYVDSNGKFVEASASDIPDGCQAAIQTDDGNVITGQLSSDGNSIVPGMTTSDGSFVPGMANSDGAFVPGMVNSEGEFVPGTVQNGQFVAGEFHQDSNGSMHFDPGIRDEKGDFHTGVVTSDGQFQALSSDGKGGYKVDGKPVTSFEGAGSVPNIPTGKPNGSNVNLNDVKVDKQSGGINTNGGKYSQSALNVASVKPTAQSGSGNIQNNIPKTAADVMEKVMKSGGFASANVGDTMKNLYMMNAILGGNSNSKQSSQNSALIRGIMIGKMNSRGSVQNINTKKK